MGDGPSRRPRAAGGRPHSITVWFSDDELAAVTAAAARTGVALRAWVPAAAVERARSGPSAAGVGDWPTVMAELMQLQGELAGVRRVAVGVATNLNQLTAAANTLAKAVRGGGGDGLLEPPTREQIEQVVAAVGRQLGRLDEVAVAVAQLLARAQARQLMASGARRGARP